MPSNEAIAFDFPEIDPEKIQEPVRPHLVLASDPKTASSLDPTFSRELDSLPRFDKSYQQTLISKLEAGDSEAKDQIFINNQRLVVKLANLYETDRLDPMDLIQAGMLGLAEAIEKFDPSRSREFGQYAARKIKNAINEAISNTEDFSSDERKNIQKVRKVGDFLSQRFMREPSLENLAIRTDMPTDKLIRLKAIENGNYSLNISILTEAEKGEASAQDLLPSRELPIDEQVENKELQETIQKLIDEKLNEREALVIRGAFGMNDRQISLTERELADQLGVNKSRVGQIKSRALEKLEGPIATYIAGAEVPDVKKFTEGITGIA